MVYKKRHIISVLANIIFVGGTILSFTSHKYLNEYFLYFVNFGCIYLFSLTGLLLSKSIIIKTLSILTCGLSAAKIFYAIWLINVMDDESRRMLFIIVSILFMILHLLAWLIHDLKYRKWIS